MPADDRIAAVVVAYNGGDDLITCVQSLIDQALPNLEIIVVDNASIDGSLSRLIAEAGSHIRVIRRATNGGYAAGANTGWRATDAPIVGIFNQDLTFEPDCLERMRRALVDEPRQALVSPKLVLKSDPTRVNAVGQNVHLSGVGWCHGLGTPAADWHGVHETTAISGAAFMARRSFLEQLGGLEEAYFMYVEDVDLSLRAWIAGGTCLAACDAVATHAWSLRLTPRKFGLLERNRRALWQNVISTGGKREQVLLIQAELLGWLYALGRGRAYVAAKAWGRHAPRLSSRLVCDVSSARPVTRRLSRRLPYSTVAPGIPGVAATGALVDHIVVRVAGASAPDRR